MLQVMAHRILRQIGDSSIIFLYKADKIADILNREQLIICLRWVNENYQPHEEFIGIHMVATTKSDVITSLSSRTFFSVML